MDWNFLVGAITGAVMFWWGYMNGRNSSLIAMDRRRGEPGPSSLGSGVPVYGSINEALAALHAKMAGSGPCDCAECQRAREQAKKN